ncbi:hypothetical protein ACH9D2_12810 [Kocuria sp. M4R2S49]
MMRRPDIPRTSAPPPGTVLLPVAGASAATGVPARSGDHAEEHR